MSSSPMMLVSLTATARSTTFRSSRMLPGQSYRSSFSTAAPDNFFGAVPYWLQMSSVRLRLRRYKSDIRSRRGGIWRWKTWIR